jgi:hypothetical protein
MSWHWRIVVCRECGREHCLIYGVIRGFLLEILSLKSQENGFKVVSLEMWTSYFPNTNRNHLARLHHVTVRKSWLTHLFLCIFKNGFVSLVRSSLVWLAIWFFMYFPQQPGRWQSACYWLANTEGSVVNTVARNLHQISNSQSPCECTWKVICRLVIWT